jgi:hypothetical protein
MIEDRNTGRGAEVPDATVGPKSTPALLLVVFISGYLVMALEILAFRIVQIFFGTAIYSTGAVLGIVLSDAWILAWRDTIGEV